MATELNEKRDRVSPGIVVSEEVIYVPEGISARDYALFKLESGAGKVTFRVVPGKEPRSLRVGEFLGVRR